MASRDPRVAALAKLQVAQVTVQKSAAQLDAARLAYHRALKAAVDAGLTKAEIARRVGTSESRLRQNLARVQDAS